MNLDNVFLRVQSSSPEDTAVAVTLAGDRTDVLSLDGVTPVQSAKQFSLLISATLSAPAAGTVTVCTESGALLISLRPGELVSPADRVQPILATTRDPVRALHGEPGYEFGTANLDDFTLTERLTVDSHAQPLPFGTPHPRNSRMLLIGQKLTDGEQGKRIHVRVYAANLQPAEQDGYGWSVTYPTVSKEHPQVTRRLKVAEEDYRGMAFAQGCLVNGYSELELVGETFEVGPTAVFGTLTLIFDAIPGPALAGEGYDENGDLETTTIQTVPANHEPPVEQMNYLVNFAEKAPLDAKRATLTLKTVAARTPLWDEDQFTVNRALMRHITGVRRTTERRIVPVGTEPDSGFLIVESSVKQKNKWQALKTTMRVDAFQDLVSTSRDPEAHGALTTQTESIVPTGTTAPAKSLPILDSKVEDLDGTHALQVVKQLAPGEEWPELVDYSFDEQTKILVEIRKKVVDAAGQVPGVDSEGYYVEYKSIDKFKSIRIRSKVIGHLPEPIVYYGTTELSLYDELLSVTPEMDKQGSASSGAGTGTRYSAEASANSSVGGGMVVNVRHGFRGTAKAKITKRFFDAPPIESDIPSPTVFRPSYGTAIIIAKGESSMARETVDDTNSSVGSSTGSSLRTNVTHIGPVLTPAVDTTTTYAGDTQTAWATGGQAGASAVANSSATIRVSIPASVPSAYPQPGDLILQSAKVEQWRLGIWVLHTVEAIVPEEPTAPVTQ
jgi:hypothetical protein